MPGIDLIEPSTKKLFSSSAYIWLIAIVFLGFVLRLAYVIFVPTQPVSDFGSYQNFAVNIIKNGVYGFGTTPSSIYSPGMSFFLTIIYYIFGIHIIYAKLAQVILGTLSIILLYFIAEKIFTDNVAIISALLLAIFPTQIEFTSILATENIFTFLILLCFFLILVVDRASKFYYPCLFIAGMALGWAILVRPVAVLLPLLLLAMIILKDHPINKQSIKSISKITIIFLIGVALLVVPWCVRNYELYDHFNISSNSGINFWIGNNENSTGVYMLMVPMINDTLGNVYNLTEFQRDDLYAQQAKKYIITHPLQTLVMDVKKIFILYGSSDSGLYWSMMASGVITNPDLLSKFIQFSPLLYALTNGFYYFILLLAIISIPMIIGDMIKNKRYLAMVIFAYLFYFSLMYSISMSDDRYNFNLLPMLGILSAYTIVKIMERTKIHSTLFDKLNY